MSRCGCVMGLPAIGMCINQVKGYHFLMLILCSLSFPHMCI